MTKSWTKEQKERFRDDYTFKFDDGESVQEVMARTIAIFNKIALLSEEAPPEPIGESGEAEAEEVGAASRDVNRSATPETANRSPDKPKIIQKTALIVAHKINLQLMILHALDATDTVVRRQTNIDRLELGNCSLSIIEVNLKGKEPFYRLLSTNDVNHLVGLKAPPTPAES
jgi:broad specificity phosphatase PhoE